MKPSRSTKIIHRLTAPNARSLVASLGIAVAACGEEPLGDDAARFRDALLTT